MDEITKEKINLEISKIDTLVSKSSLLLTKCQNTEPDFFDLNAAGSILHSFYLEEPLKEYLGFRHVFRHSYGYELDWERLSPLFSGMTEIWQKVKTCFVEFME